ncbi:unnamed protein product [Callosobruchus maculatus]|uniref:J domain-containing protein n=1 Tax=Callosobruchus maculatus TaxID=64391 RepID=A0A653DGF1_CALMS|nr:unnamed protein product [Callosobruchus maculatus]
MRNHLKFLYEILADDTKRKQYDTWGSTAEQMGGMGGASAGGGGSGPQGFSQHWQYQSTIDPEELFRKIFGDAGFGKGSSPFDDFAESNYGFGQAQEQEFERPPFNHIGSLKSVDWILMHHYLKTEWDWPD